MESDLTLDELTLYQLVRPTRTSKKHAELAIKMLFGYASICGTLYRRADYWQCCRVTTTKGFSRKTEWYVSWCMDHFPLVLEIIRNGQPKNGY
jgi:hypothetical protein